MSMGGLEVGFEVGCGGIAMATDSRAIRLD